jgi:hypothetical protein
MQFSRPEPSLTCVVSILTVCWMLSFTSCTEVTEVLSARGFTDVPKNLSEDLVTLDLSDNNITAIKIDDFITLKQVRMIDLSYNQIQILHELSFEHVYCLEELDLSYNNIVHLSHTIFSSNQNLKKLYLKKNNLQISGHLSKTQHILDSKSLMYLDVSFCSITYISCESLEGLPNLKTFITDGNPLTQQNFEIKYPPKNLKKIKPDFCNFSIFEKFCCNLQEQGVETTSLTVIHEIEAKEKNGLNAVTLTTAFIMCAVVFIVVVICYIVIRICKNRKARLLAIKRRNQVNVMQNRPLPFPPFQEDEYEVPIKPNNESTSPVISSNLHLNRNCGYIPVPSEENDSLIKTYITTYHVSVETNNESTYCLSGSTEYHDNVPYPSSIYIYSSKEEENNLPIPPINEKLSISTSPHFSGANRTSTTGIPPRPCQNLGYLQAEGYLENNKSPTRPTPTSPASPTRNVTTFCVKKVNSEHVFVSSTSIELGNGS